MVNVTHLLHRRLGGFQDPSKRVRKISPPTGIQSPDRPARSVVAIPTELSRPSDFNRQFIYIYLDFDTLPRLTPLHLFNFRSMALSAARTAYHTWNSELEMTSKEVVVT